MRRTTASLTLLVVEDDADLRLYVRQCVERETGPLFRVIEAADGLSGLEVLETEHVDVVVCDIVMHRMDGFELCARLRENPATSGVPVLLMTGVATSGDSLRRAREVGADGVLPKPFNARRLRAAIDSAMRARGLGEAPA